MALLGAGSRLSFAPLAKAWRRLMGGQRMIFAIERREGDHWIELRRFGSKDEAMDSMQTLAADVEDPSMLRVHTYDTSA